MFASFFLLLSQNFFLVSHLSSPGSFPQPLSSEEERSYFEKMKCGDSEARNILIERNLRLVAHVVKRYNNSGYDSDDLISIGTIGLIKAISTYDVEKNIRFATYASTCINNEMLMLMRSGKKVRNEVYTEEPIGFDKEGNEINLMNILYSEDEDVLERLELKMQIKKLYEFIRKVLKDREKRVLELRYGLNSGTEMTQREIAKMLGISRSYVSRIEKKAISKLSEEFKNIEK